MRARSLAIAALLFAAGGLPAASFADKAAHQPVRTAVAETRRLRHWGGGWAVRYQYRSRPGWSVAEGKRRARKARNRARHKCHLRGR